MALLALNPKGLGVRVGKDIGLTPNPNSKPELVEYYVKFSSRVAAPHRLEIARRWGFQKVWVVCKYPKPLCSHYRHFGKKTPAFLEALISVSNRAGSRRDMYTCIFTGCVGSCRFYIEVG